MGRRISLRREYTAAMRSSLEGVRPFGPRNVDARGPMHRLLQMWGYDPHVAEDGPTGVRAALAHRPAVALIDLGLPGLDGYEVARRIRAAPGGAAVRLVALTGYGEPEDRNR